MKCHKYVILAKHVQRVKKLAFSWFSIFLGNHHETLRRSLMWNIMVLRSITVAGEEVTILLVAAGAVGEKCRRVEHCAAVQGSGAVCSQCGLCRCRVSGHVPDILGTTCGPGEW